MNRLLLVLVGTVVWWYAETRPQTRRDQRGLTQSTENAILLAGAVAVAVAVIAAVTAYVTKHLPK